MKLKTPKLNDRNHFLHLDPSLFWGLIVLSLFGLFILFSAAQADIHVAVRQLLRLGLAYSVLIFLAQIPPWRLRSWSPWLFGFGMILVIAVTAIGQIGKGAQRWLDLGIITFQPSEIMKIATPMMIAWILSNAILPPSIKRITIAAILIALPAALIAKQPDLGTALMIAFSGGAVLFLAGISWWLIGGCVALVSAISPIAWHFLYDYQRQRVLTFLNPENDPLGKGYHIIQSKIAVGSGGVLGKGWMKGTQAYLDFLPEHATDFIFAVCGEELGLIGCSALIFIYLFITWRSFQIATRAQDTFSRLLAGSISLTFFLSIFVNMGMVIGILPVVGMPLALVSYGGTSMVTVMAGFGILMSIQTHRQLVSR